MEKFELIYGILSRTASSEEENEFREWVKENDNRELFEKMQRIWQESPNVKNYRKHDAVKSFYQMDRKIQSRQMLRRKVLFTAISGVAAGIIIMLGLFNFTNFQALQSKTNEQVYFQTELGNRSLVYLPDGSKVWLNAKSELKYDSDFNVAEREVILQGEAFFDVERAEKPFVVHVNDLKVKVYGTKFNVSAYADEPVIETSLESGKVSIQNQKSEEYFIKPGELAIYDKSTSQIETKKVDPIEYSGWRDNKIYLHNEPIEVLARKLERQYNVTVGFTPATIGREIHYTGVFGNESLEEILKAISTASDLSVQKKGNHYQISQ